MEISVDIRENLLRARNILTSPKKFFKTIQKEKSWKRAFSFVLVTVFIGHVCTTLYNLFLYPTVTSSLGPMMGVAPINYNLPQVLTAAVISYIVTLGMSFIWGGALKVWLSLFKVNSTFAQGYKVMAYSRTPNYLLSWIPFVNVLAAFYSFYLMFLALENEYSLPRKKALIIIFSSVILLFIVSFVGFSLLWQSSQL